MNNSPNCFGRYPQEPQTRAENDCHTCTALGLCSTYTPEKVVPETNILREAESVVWGDREKTYSAPGKNLTNIARLWTAYLISAGIVQTGAEPLTAHGVAHMMMLLKIARLINSPGHRDSLVDVAGYAALSERIEREA